MKFSLFIFVVLVGLFVFGSSVKAADMVFEDDFIVEIGGHDYVILAGSEATTLDVGATTVTVTVPSNSTFTFQSPDRHVLNNDANIDETCTDEDNRLAITGPKNDVVITPDPNTLCTIPSLPPSPPSDSTDETDEEETEVPSLPPSDSTGEQETTESPTTEETIEEVIEQDEQTATTTVLFSEGTAIRGPDGIRVYVVNEHGYKRHIFNPTVFSMYRHLSWTNIVEVTRNILDSFITSTLYRVFQKPEVYNINEIDEREGKATKHHINTSSDGLLQQGHRWEQVFIINEEEGEYYQTGEDEL